MKKKKTKTEKNDFEIFHMLTQSIAWGFVRLYSARIASNTFKITYSKYQIEKKSEELSEFGKKSTLDELHSKEFDAFCYVSNLSLLIYATTLLDTFLSETVKFLIMRHPQILEGDVAVDYSDILNAPSKSVILTNTISEKAKKLSYLSFLERIGYLKKKFGLKIELDQDTIDSLSHFTNLRNVVVHDQSVYELYFNEKMELDLNENKCPVHPTPISDKELLKSWESYRQVIKTIYFSVVSQILKCEKHKSVKSFINFLEFEV